MEDDINAADGDGVGGAQDGLGGVGEQGEGEQGGGAEGSGQARGSEGPAWGAAGRAGGAAPRALRAAPAGACLRPLEPRPSGIPGATSLASSQFRVN